MTSVLDDAASRAAPPSERESSRWPTGQVLRPVGGFVVVIAAWELLARTVLDGQHVLAPPSGIVRAIVDNWTLYRRAVVTTLGEAARGFLWGNAAAIVLALFVAVLPTSERVVLRISLVVYCLPLVAIGPLLRVISASGDTPQVTLAALAVFYTTLVPLLVGLRAVPQNWVDLVHSYGRGRFVTFHTVRARAAVPYFVAGLQVAAPAAFLGALVGEYTGAERGVGVLTINAMRALRTDELWALAALSAAVSMAGYALAGLLGRRLGERRPSILLSAAGTGMRRSRSWRAGRAVIEVLVTIAVVLVGWSGLIRLYDLNPYFAKRPGDVWQALVSGPIAAGNRHTVFHALGETAQVAIPGYLLGLLLGVAVAALFDLSPTVRRTATPFTVALRCVPIVAIAPLLVQAFGRGVGGTMVTVAILTFFPTLVACAQGLRQTPGQVLDLYAVYDTSAPRTLMSAQLPAMVPAFFAAARIAVPATVLAATVAEWLATGTGMGNLMSVSAVNSRYDLLWSSVVVITVLAAAAYGLVAMLERFVLARVAPEQLSW
ncbi:MAG: ABC transporter permease subunit [Ilumatobacteraceae bacterium]